MVLSGYLVFGYTWTRRVMISCFLQTSVVPGGGGSGRWSIYNMRATVSMASVSRPQVPNVILDMDVSINWDGCPYNKSLTSWSLH